MPVWHALIQICTNPETVLKKLELLLKSEKERKMSV